MDMETWAEKEVNIACELERAASQTPDCEWDYGCACYNSALKAFKCLLEDGHSGMSSSLTKKILNRLIDGKPLTPIEDTDDTWTFVRDSKDGYKHYQCKRMSSFFKDVYQDGTVEYIDIDRCWCIDTDSPNASYISRFVRRIIDEMFPITMPYDPPTDGYKVVCETFLFNPNNGDFDTRGILYVITPYGDRVEINRYFAEVNGEFIEINKEQYELRKMLVKGE